MNFFASVEPQVGCEAVCLAMLYVLLCFGCMLKPPRNVWKIEIASARYILGIPDHFSVNVTHQLYIQYAFTVVSCTTL